jgi:hypothetical protein
MGRARARGLPEQDLWQPDDCAVAAGGCEPDRGTSVGRTLGSTGDDEGPARAGTAPPPDEPDRPAQRSSRFNSTVSTTDAASEKRIIATQPGPPPTGRTSTSPNRIDPPGLAVVRTTYPPAARLTPRTASRARVRDTWSMGFNPHRTHRRSIWDYVFVASAMLVAAALVLWAVFA